MGRHKISLGGRAGGLTAVEHRVLQLLGGTEAAAEDIIAILRYYTNKISRYLDFIHFVFLYLNLFSQHFNSPNPGFLV